MKRSEAGLPSSPAAASGALARRMGRLAVASLHAELALAYKPGLVTPLDNGSHDDMDAGTFWRSLSALRGYFVDIAQAGIDGAGLDTLRRLGLRAEDAMLGATDGINTHRGAIFSLGLLTAQAAQLHAQAGTPASGAQVCAALVQWAGVLLDAPLDPGSHGQRMCREHGVPGVREQAAAGYPLLREVALPALRQAMDAGVEVEATHAHALLSLIAAVDDLNLLHRGGIDGLRFAQSQAKQFLDRGSVWQDDWRGRLAAMGEAFVARRLSPGGSADLLACAVFLQRQATA
jgi:triphosphoribosyl-dephospho-CoA synthase